MTTSPEARTKEERAIDWRAQLDKRLDGMSETIERYIMEKVKEEYADLLGNLTIYPESKRMNVEIWGCDQTVLTLSLDRIVCDWFLDERDPPKKENLFLWINGLESLAAKLRQAIADGKYDDEK